MPQLLRHRGRSIWPYLFFMCLFMAMLILVSQAYLLPALADYNQADATARKVLAAHALLMLTLILVILLLVMVLVFRVGKFFLPGPSTPPSKTEYTDAWAESGKRMQPPKDE